MLTAAQTMGPMDCEKSHSGAPWRDGVGAAAAATEEPWVAFSAVESIEQAWPFTVASAASRDSPEKSAAARRQPVRFDKPPAVSPRAASYIYAMLVAVDRTLSSRGIRYYAEGGTLIGLARDGGIIRHDDDADIQIHPDDTEKLLASAPAIEAELQAWASSVGERVVLRRATFGFKLVLLPQKPEERWELYFESLFGEWCPGFAIVDFFIMELHPPLAPTEQQPLLTWPTDARVRYTDPVIRRMVAERGNGDILYARLGTLPYAPFGPIFIRAPEDLRGATMDQFGTQCFNKVESKDGAVQKHDGTLAVEYDKELFERLMAPPTVALP